MAGRGTAEVVVGAGLPALKESFIQGDETSPLRRKMESIGRYVMIGGIVLFLVGGTIFLSAKLGLPLGRLPGDIRIERDGSSFYFPITTSILLSVLLTLVLIIIGRWKR